MYNCSPSWCLTSDAGHDDDSHLRTDLPAAHCPADGAAILQQDAGHLAALGWLGNNTTVADAAVAATAASPVVIGWRT